MLYCPHAAQSSPEQPRAAQSSPEQLGGAAGCELGLFGSPIYRPEARESYLRRRYGRVDLAVGFPARSAVLLPALAMAAICLLFIGRLRVRQSLPAVIVPLHRGRALIISSAAATATAAMGDAVWTGPAGHDSALQITARLATLSARRASASYGIPARYLDALGQKVAVLSGRFARGGPRAVGAGRLWFRSAYTLFELAVGKRRSRPLAG